MQLFEKDIWKDARKLTISSGEAQVSIRRYSDFQTSIHDEIRFISELRERISFQIPEVTKQTEHYISFQYIHGTRAFNLLMDLRALYRAEKNRLYKDLGFKIIDILADDLTDFQTNSPRLIDESLNPNIYPAFEKIQIVYGLLTSVLSLKQPLHELKPITDLYLKNAPVPFRDATPKNAILHIPELFQQQFKSFDDRLLTVKKMTHSGELARKIDKTNIFHIDFSGCCFLCPQLDDWIALKEHESSIWLRNDPTPDFDQQTPEELCTRFVRYSRFGGRKLLYRLLNRAGHRIRFALDSEALYFRELRSICRSLYHQEFLVSQTLLKLMESLEEATRISPEKDYFHSWKKQLSPPTYYRDVFPN